MTGVNDGKFTISKGQGISQAIAEEIGLTNEQCKKVDWKSVFAIVNEAKGKEGNNVNWEGGNDPFAPASQNYVVHEGDKFEFSKEMWEKITDVVSNSLNKTKQTKVLKADDLKFTVSDAKAQKEYDRANQILTDVASMNPKLPVIDDAGKLPNGGQIRIVLDENNNIAAVAILGTNNGAHIGVNYSSDMVGTPTDGGHIMNNILGNQIINATGPLPKDYKWIAIQQVAKQILGMS